MARQKRSFLDDEGDDGGDQIMASFADMMTLLLGFFMILYSMSFEDERKFYEFGKAISSSISKDDTNENETSILKEDDYHKEARAFQMLTAVLNLGDSNEAINKTQQMYMQLLEKEATKKSVKEDSAEVKALQGKIKSGLDKDSRVILDLIIPSKELFTSGSSRISPRATAKIKNLALLLEKIKSNAKFSVIGHTDSRPMRSGSKDNWSLSADRAIAVARILIKYGIQENKINIVGQAGSNPLYPEYTKQHKLIRENLAKNRRIQIKVERLELQVE